MTGGSFERKLAVATHPVLALAVVWAVAVPAWALAGESVLEASIAGERASSVRAFLYFLGCLVGFAAGALIAGLAWPRGTAQPLTLERYPGLPFAARAMALATLAGGIIWLARISLLVGSPFTVLELFLSGASVADLKSTVFIPAQLPPFTTLVHLTPAAASLLLVHRRVTGWGRLEWALMAGLVTLAGVRTFLMAERLAGLGLLTAICVTLLFTADRIAAKRVITTAAASLFILWFAWSAGEFSRSWMDSRDGESARFTLANFRASLSYSQERLGAYLFTAVNNGVIIVDEWPGQSFPANFVPLLGRAGVGGEVGASDLYNSDLSREFTGESMPGRFYLDAREYGVVLAAVYGVVFGLAWRAATLRSVAGIVLHAALFHVLLDSYRSAYLFDLQGAAAFAGAGIALLASARPHARSRTRQAPLAADEARAY